MIVLKVIRWKNFLSTGNAFTEIELNKAQTSFIVGANGHGKSTILDALTFVLFGKPFRKINKPALVNSVNNKDCVVEIEFETHGKQYKIIRGIKPNIFEIYVDDELLNQDSASKDYQEYLEKYILKMNMKSFSQIVILGSASFVPFMQLSPADRRTIIEDLLDIQIFSVMSLLMKQRFQENKDLIERNRIELGSREEKKKFIEKTLTSLRKNNEDKLKDLEEQLASLNEQKKTLLAAVQIIIDEKEQLVNKVLNLDDDKKRYEQMIKYVATLDADTKRLDVEKDFIKHSETCPTCKQTIDANFKSKRVLELAEEISKQCVEAQAKEIDSNALLSSITEKEKYVKRIQNINTEISKNKSMMMHLVSSINDTEDAIDKIKNSDTLIQENEKELATTENEIAAKERAKNNFLLNKQMIDVATQLLKDGGIKTKIIKQYIPIINKVVNKYLSQMGFFVNFNVNENFEEVIKSRYRDEFSYANFSEGEKTRIDLALLFTWRHIAKLKNSVNTNLLLLDEILDGSLDANGTDEFLKIIKDLTDGTNTFIISHKTDQLVDKFDRVYRFEKVQNFSRLVT
jgi:DNA repair exonuclease SbcCD ATPase subunit